MSNVQPQLSECTFALAAIAQVLGALEAELAAILADGHVADAEIPRVTAIGTRLAGLRQEQVALVGRVEGADINVRVAIKLLRGVPAPGRDLARQLDQWAAVAREEVKAA